MNRIVVLMIFLCVFTSIVYTIEVGGHLTEDTIWLPENNPYEVLEDVYVDEGVTLNILPGTVIKFNAAPDLNLYSMEQYFVHYNCSNIAKMLWVDGTIIAEGTEDEPILFTRLQDSLYYHWGIIYLREEAGLSSFKHCTFCNSAFMLIVLGIIPRGAISIYNQGAIIDNCTFIDNKCGVFVDRTPINLQVTNNTFYNIDNLSDPMYHQGGYSSFTTSIIPSNNILIGGNIFMESGTNNHIGAGTEASFYITDNSFQNVEGILIGYDSEKTSFIYNNQFTNCGSNGAIYGGNPVNSIYIKKNDFIGGIYGIDLNYAYVEISDNYFEGCDVDTYFASGKIYNNIINNGEVWTPGELEVLNNICFNNNDGYGLKFGYNPYCTNNISINNKYAIWSAELSYENCIIIDNEELTEHYVSGNPIFRNCIIDFPLEPPLIDGGGNIIVDSLQTQEIFEDIENGDYHLALGSIAIDAGFDTLGYYYPFDLENSLRVWDGDGDGNAVIDIGAYEYGAPQLGKITGYITETDTGEPVDYVLLKADNEPGNFIFADSSGYFEIQLPTGTYDLFAERVFYEDNIIYNVTVENEQNTEIAFNMTYEDPLVSINGNEIQNISGLNLKNYPNPFNPTTNISFNLPNESKVVLSVFNIKGQLVKNLVNTEMPKGQHSVFWNGLNERNRAVSSGVYLYKLKASNQESVKRMILLK